MIMQISTVTCHDVYNYGASLQAYALQEYCKSLGAYYKIIDYKPPYLSNHYKLDAVSNPRYDKPIIKQAYLLAKLPGRLKLLKRKRLFDDFTAKYLELTGKRYTSNEEIERDCPESDLYIAVSDQIWNTLFKNGRDPAFYLDFVKDRGRKISYAASFATERIFNNAEAFVKNKIQNFDAISVRESSALDLLANLGRTDGTLVADPVFLLSRAEWMHLINNCKETGEQYILVYDCEQSAKLRELAIELRKTKGLKIYALSSTKGKYADKNFGLSGPIEFLNLISNARYVLANSFHALAFSLIFHKNVFITNRSEEINTRMRDFMQYLGIERYLINDVSGLREECINYESVDNKLNSLIADSKTFIRTQMELSINE